MTEQLIVERPKRAWAWAWLAYTAFLFIDPIMEPSWRRWLIALGALATFLAIFAVYEQACEKRSRLRYWMIGATFLLGLAVFPFNPGASTFFVFAGAFLPFNIRSIPRVLGLFCVEGIAIFAESYYLHLGWPNAAFAVFLLFVIGGGNNFFAAQKRADTKLREALEANVTLAAVAERERIARDLHDVLGHTLSVIVLKAELAGRLMERDPQRAAAEIADVERTARTALAEVREAIGGYRSHGLAAEIEAARRTLDAAEVSLIADATPEGAANLSAAEETVLALALREAVTNIVRHAKAKTCRLRFVVEDGRRKLIVEDDGAHSSTREGNGLRGMRERVEALGGRMQLERESGTRLLIDLPIHTQGATS